MLCTLDSCNDVYSTMKIKRTVEWSVLDRGSLLSVMVFFHDVLHCNVGLGSVMNDVFFMYSVIHCGYSYCYV